jgi:hypothetical protein
VVLVISENALVHSHLTHLFPSVICVTNGVMIKMQSSNVWNINHVGVVLMIINEILKIHEIHLNLLCIEFLFY